MENVIKDGAFLVDVRTPAEFAEGHVNGSTNIPLDQVATELEQFKGKEQIIVFCRSGNRSGQAKMILEQNGFKNVINGGTWQDVKEAIEK
jgi:rhodanese-related sulfurtransferase